MTEYNMEEMLKTVDEKYLFYLKNSIVRELQRRLEEQSRK